MKWMDFPWKYDLSEFYKEIGHFKAGITQTSRKNTKQRS